MLTVAAPLDTPALSFVASMEHHHHDRRLDDNEAARSLFIVAAVNTTLDTSAKAVAAFVARTDAFLQARIGSDIDEVEEQEKMACLFQDECLGGVQDYTDAFRRAFQVTGHPRCKTIVDEIRSGVDTMALAYWKERMTRAFGCPFPTPQGRHDDS